MTVIMLSQLVCLTFYTVFNLWSLYISMLVCSKASGVYVRLLLTTVIQIKLLTWNWVDRTYEKLAVKQTQQYLHTKKTVTHSMHKIRTVCTFALTEHSIQQQSNTMKATLAT